MGERKLCGRVTSIDNSDAKSFHLVAELPIHADAIRLVIANNQPRFSDICYIAKAVALPSTADLNGSGLAWSPVTQGGQAYIPTTVAAQSYQPEFTFSDLIPLRTIPRTDSGTKPLVAVRGWFSGNATLPASGISTDDFTNWASRTDGLLWVMRHQAGNAVTDPTLFTSTVNRSQSPIVGIQFLARGRVVRTARFGDSNTEGRGTWIGEGFVGKAIQAVSTATKPLTDSNNGFSGQPMNYITDRAIDFIENPRSRPDIAIIPSGSPNDETSSLTAAGIANQRSCLLRILAACKANGVTPVVWTMLPVNTAVNPWGATDALRVAHNADVLALRDKGILVADTAAAISGATSGGQVQMASGTTIDGIHPDSNGENVLAPPLQAEIAKAA
ncbi:hypothetical protein CH296_28260 [Rhodococcus sp. 14-2496-1d]|nr:hypothetical protein CH296_28260 [Rhodococcus sp. 14-2496-1d]